MGVRRAVLAFILARSLGLAFSLVVLVLVFDFVAISIALHTFSPNGAVLASCCL
jgi:hypothetical protein